MRSLLKVLALLAVLGVPAEAADGVKFGGFAKDLYLNSRSVLDDKPYWHNLARAQVTMDARMGWLTSYVAYNHELRHGTYFETLDYRLFDLGADTFYYEWQGREEGGRTWQRNHGLYRAYVGLEGEQAALRYGRQRIAWGTGKLWNPTDVLNPFVYQSVEREEQRGVDSAYLRLPEGDLSQFEAVYAPQDTYRETQFFERFRSHFGRTDVSFMGGKAAGDREAWMLGGDFAADVGGGNLHGEVTVTEPQVRDAYLKALLGCEYRFLAGEGPAAVEGLWVVAEYYRNGAGEADKALYRVGDLLSGREVNLGRDYLGLGATKEITPLWTAELYGALNLNDRSLFVNPSVRWNAMTDLDVTAGIQWFDGVRLSEFGRFHPVASLQAKYYFPNW